MAYKKLKLYFDKDLTDLLSDKILAVDSSFNEVSFKKNILSKIGDLELKDRVEVFADELYGAYSSDYKSAINILLQILGPENENETGMFKEYYWVMPIAKVVEKYGLDNFKLSMKALEEVTKRNTSEYAIRPYLVKYQNRTITKMEQWSRSSNKHVRRLSCEGLRPRLPWATKLDNFINDPTPILPILNNLKADKSKYVQKSVANCINDILKDNLEIATQLIEDWMTAERPKETNWIIKHAIRNLIKAEDEWALGIKEKVT